MESYVPSPLVQYSVNPENYFSQIPLKLYCSVCNKEFENIFCSTQDLFLTDNILCSNCKETNYVIIRNKQINIYSKTNSPEIGSSRMIFGGLTEGYGSLRKTPLEGSVSTSHKKSSVSPLNNPKTLELCCGDISPKFNNYYINVSEDDILKSIQKMIDYPIEDIKTVFASCLREILKYEPSTIHDFYVKRSIEWKNWCDDIVIYFVCRKKIFGKKIPIANFEEECKPNCNCMDK